MIRPAPLIAGAVLVVLCFLAGRNWHLTEQPFAQLHDALAIPTTMSN